MVVNLLLAVIIIVIFSILVIGFILFFIFIQSVPVDGTTTNSEHAIGLYTLPNPGTMPDSIAHSWEVN